MLRLSLLAIAGLITLPCCTGDIEQPELDRSAPLRLPPFDEGFATVSAAVVPSCGTLDCHGHSARNLRLIGYAGMTTLDQALRANYWSIVALEPEALGAVVRDGGRDPERLSLIRKARGTEKHKGGTVMNVGDDLDRCLLSWLAGAADTAACKKVSDDLEMRIRRL